jgi:hypothetical protein
MMRIVLGGLAAAIFLLFPAASHGDSGLRVRGTVALKDTSSQVVTLRAARLAVALRVPGSLSLIRVGQRVELRGSTLRQRGRGSRVLARNVTVASTQPLAAPGGAPNRDDDDDEVDDDEVEIKGTLTSLSPLTVRSATRTVTCVVPAGTSLGGFAVGDFVEITCDLKAGVWVLRVLKHEDDDDDDDERRGRDDDDDDNSGPGSGHDDDDDDDNSGPGGGGPGGHGGGDD